jgi:hypothetical protein
MNVRGIQIQRREQDQIRLARIYLKPPDLIILSTLYSRRLRVVANKETLPP